MHFEVITKSEQILSVQHQQLTQFIKVSVDAIWTWHRANQTSFEERCPLIHQTSVPPEVILKGENTGFRKCACEWSFQIFLLSSYLETDVQFISQNKSNSIIDPSNYVFLLYFGQSYSLKLYSRNDSQHTMNILAHDTLHEYLLKGRVNAYLVTHTENRSQTKAYRTEYFIS